MAATFFVLGEVDVFVYERRSSAFLSDISSVLTFHIDAVPVGTTF